MGRGTRKDENLMASVVNLSWEMVQRILTGKGYTMEKKEAVALEIVKKSVPKEIKLKGDEVNPLLVKFLHDNGNPQ